MTPRRQYQLAPAPVTGYPLDGRWSVIVPYVTEITNLITNPSVETNTTGWAAASGAETLARTIDQQRRGAYSLRVTPTNVSGEGAYHAVSLTAGTPYTAAIDLFGIAGVTYRIGVFTTAGARVRTFPTLMVTATGRWQRLNIFGTVLSSAAHRLYIQRIGTHSGVWYVDGALVAATTFSDPMRYFDGDSHGLIPKAKQIEFLWTGLRHGSTSIMRSHARAGGRIIPLSTYGFTLLAMIGLGLPQPNNLSVPLALPGGAQYQRTVTPEHSFDLVGYLEGDSLADLLRRDAALADALDVRRQPVTQTLLLQYELLDECQQPISDLLEIECSYAGGLDGPLDNHYQKNVAPRFTVHLPVIGRLAGSDAGALDVQDSTANAAYLIRRMPNGTWESLGTGPNNDVEVIRPDPLTGRVYVGGSFNFLNGVSASRIGYWDPALGDFVAMDLGAVNGTVMDIAIEPNGDVWVCGTFTQIGSGAAATKGLARWNLASGTWTAFNVSTATFSGVYTCALDSQLNLYIGGLFTDWNGNANSDGVARRSAAGTWSNLSTGLAGVKKLRIDRNDLVYLVGEAATVGVRTWNGSAFTQIGAVTGGATNQLDVVFIDPDNGLVYVGGNGAAINGVTISNIAVWNGVAWQSLGSGIGNPAVGTSFVYGIAKGTDGLVYAVGAFGPFQGNISAAWNGSAWVYVDETGSTAPYTVSALRNGELWFGYLTTQGTARFAGSAVLTNTGSADTYPVIIYTHAGSVNARLYSLRNWTTQQAIYLELEIQPGETITLDLRPGQKSLISSARGNLTAAILPGSNLATFKLAPGPNTIGTFSTVASGDLPTAHAWWVPAYNNLASVVR